MFESTNERFRTTSSGDAQRRSDEEVQATKEVDELKKNPSNLTVPQFTSLLRKLSPIAHHKLSTDFYDVVAKSGMQLEANQWNSLIHLVGKSGSLEGPMKVFEDMKRNNVKPDVQVWNNLIGIYGQRGRAAKALELFQQMQQSGTKPNSGSLVSVLNAYNYSGLVDECKNCLDSMESKFGIVPTVDHQNCFVDALCRAGKIEEAGKFANSMTEPDLATQTLLDTGRTLIEAESKTRRKGRPILSSFSRSASSSTASLFGNQSTSSSPPSPFGKVPTAATGFGNQTASPTSLFGNQAQTSQQDSPSPFSSLFGNRPSSPSSISGNQPQASQQDSSSPFSSLFGNRSSSPSSIFGNQADSSQSPISPFGSQTSSPSSLFGDQSAPSSPSESLLDSQPRSLFDSSISLLNNPQPKQKYLNQSAAKRALRRGRMLNPPGVQSSSNMQNTGIKKPGQSWLEVDGKIHVFIAHDRRHPMTKQIYDRLKVLHEDIKKAGYVADTKWVLQNVDEEAKLQSLASHSERLAVSFALLTTPPGSRLTIMKNLRICGDCHTAFKIISKVEGREIVCRDTSRFHHFKDGSCSCNDYY